jgi:hypothetical protein
MRFAREASLQHETGRVELNAKTARGLFSRPAFAASTEATRCTGKAHHTSSDLAGPSARYRTFFEGGGRGLRLG